MLADIPVALPGVPLARRASRLRNSLRYSVYEGITAEIVGACSGGAILTGWALYVHASPLVLGLIVALPQLAQCVQLPAAWITSTFGSRPTTIVAVGAGRQVLLGLCLLPWMPAPTREPLLVAVAGVSTLLGVIGNNGWVSWMSDLVPSAIRGRYFGRRTAVCTGANAVGSLAASALLDFARKHEHEGAALAVLAFIAAVAGALSTYLMLRQQAPPAQPECTTPPSVLTPLRDGAARRLLHFQIGWNAAVGLAASFFTAFMLQDLQMSFVDVAIYGVVVAVLRMAMSPLWGRVIDRIGAKPVLVTCSYGIAFIPLLWLLATPDQLWPVAVDALSTGLLWSGHAQATFQLPLVVSPQRGRPYYLAAFAAAAGLSFAAATAGAGWLAGQVPAGIAVGTRHLAALQILFALSAVARLLAATLAGRVAEPRPLPIRRRLPAHQPLWTAGGTPPERAMTG